MLRWMMFGCVALLGIFEVASAATISAVLKPDVTETLTGYATRKVGEVVTPYFFGPIPNPQPIGVNVVKDSVQLNDGIVSVRTDFRTTLGTGTQSFNLTTYAWFQYDATFAGITEANDTFVQNKAYVEFDVIGNYDWSISGSDPLASSLGTDNRRSYRFASVDGSNNETTIHDSDGTGVTNPSGSAEIGSGKYRLYFDHSDTYKYTARANAVNLDITFTFKSEDNGGGGGGGVVPEPSSVAVFGLLSLGGAVAKWRRKKTQPAV